MQGRIAQKEVKKMLNNYETIFIVNAQLEEEKLKSVVEKINGLLQKSSQIESIDEWGKRKMAYPINDINEGYYVFANFASEPQFPKELERVYKITDGILRYLVIKK